VEHPAHRRGHLSHGMAIDAAPVLRHQSTALQMDHDESIPVYLPLLFGFFASFICGVLNFGDAMTYTLLWNFARYMAWLGPHATFAKGVVYSQVIFEQRSCCKQMNTDHGTPHKAL
jgi:hypothetical protein